MRQEHQECNCSESLYHRNIKRLFVSTNIHNILGTVRGLYIVIAEKFYSWKQWKTLIFRLYFRSQKEKISIKYFDFPFFSSNPFPLTSYCPIFQVQKAEKRDKGRNIGEKGKLWRWGLLFWRTLPPQLTDDWNNIFLIKV